MISCAIWYHMYNLKNVKSTHGGALWVFIYGYGYYPQWVFFAFFKLYKDTKSGKVSHTRTAKNILTTETSLKMIMCYLKHHDDTNDTILK